MKELLQDKSNKIPFHVQTVSDCCVCMQLVSEWGALLDYCELTPLRLSEARLEQDEPTRPLWIVGAGKFGRSESPSILSVPSETWRPELIFLGEKWMVDFVQEHPRLMHDFMWDVSEIVENIGHTAAVLSWKDGEYLNVMHRVADIEAGMVVYHLYPINDRDNGCWLNWLPKMYCESMIGRLIRDALGKSNLKWMMRGTEWDNNMLTSVEINNASLPKDHMHKFSERIVKLMKEVDKWYEKED
jgi:hypothetical protein